MREVRRALLEADVNLTVVRDFVSEASERATGEKVLSGIKPGQQVVKVVHDQLVELLGGSEDVFSLPSERPLVVLLMGLQGSGKTTTAAKLARWLVGTAGLGAGECMLVAADLRRPAAVEQLKVLAGKCGASFHSPVEAGSEDVHDVVRTALERGSAGEAEAVILDTAGRMHVDREMLKELATIGTEATPGLSLLVLDGLSGQDALNVASEFDAGVGFDAAILTKMDGDSRGGAALSFRSVTGKPIALLGTGEGLDGLEVFDPGRMARRILGMGDVVGLVERAREAMDEEQAREVLQRAGKGEFTLEDFSSEIGRLRKMGSLGELAAMLPGGARMRRMPVPDDRYLVRTEAIISSMTPGERRRPSIIDGSRRRRIASGSGTSVAEVNRLLKDFRALKSILGRMRSGRGSAGLGELIHRMWR